MTKAQEFLGWRCECGRWYKNVQDAVMCGDEYTTQWGWICGYCGEFFLTKEEAEECCASSE